MPPPKVKAKSRRPSTCAVTAKPTKHVMRPVFGYAMKALAQVRGLVYSSENKQTVS